MSITLPSPLAPRRRCPCALVESLIDTLEGLGYKVDVNALTVADATIALQVWGLGQFGSVRFASAGEKLACPPAWSIRAPLLHWSLPCEAACAPARSPPPACFPIAPPCSALSSTPTELHGSAAAGADERGRGPADPSRPDLLPHHLLLPQRRIRLIFLELIRRRRICRPFWTWHPAPPHLLPQRRLQLSDGSSQTAAPTARQFTRLPGCQPCTPEVPHSAASGGHLMSG